MDVPVLATSTTSPPRPRSAPWCRPSRTWSRSGQDLADEELVAVAPITSGRAPAPPVEVRAAGGVAPLVARTAW